MLCGNGERTIVFAHGYGGNRTMWNRVLPSFQKDFTCLSFDHMGFGQSDLTQFSFEKYSTLQAYAYDVIAILDEAKVKGTVFVGHSLSCMVGLLVGIQRPDLISAQVMLAPSPCYLNEVNYHGGLNLAQIMGLLDNIETNFHAWADGMTKMVMGNEERPFLAEELKHSFCKTGPSIMRHFAEVVFLSDFRSELHHLDMPTMILQCTADQIAGEHIGHYLKQNIYGSSQIGRAHV